MELWNMVKNVLPRGNAPMFSVFISSTFKDMQHERDLIHKYVYPKLKDFSAPYGDFASIIDLRWGVDTSNLDSADAMNHVLDVCCKKIEDCFPFFIAILGYRYGSKLYQYKGHHYTEGISVTEFEIKHRLALSGNHFCFFIKIPQEGIEIEPEQRELIGFIKENYPNNVIPYSMHNHGIESLPSEEDRHFITLINGKIKEYLQIYSESATNCNDYFEYIQETAKHVYGREKIVGEIGRELNSGKKLILIEGLKGVGRRCVLYKALSLFDCNAVGVTNASVGGANSEIELFEDLERQLCILLGKSPTETEKSVQKEADLFKNGIKEYSKTNTKKLFVIIENADRLLSEKEVLLFHDILKDAPRCIQFCFTVEQKEMLAPLFSEADNCIISIPLLSFADRKQVITAMYDKYGKELPNAVMEAIIHKPLSPFADYLNTMLIRLVNFDATDISTLMHSEKSGITIGDTVANNLQKYIIAMPDEHQALYTEVLNELASKVNCTIAKEIIEWLFFCPDGLRELDLKCLICGSGRISEMDFSLSFWYLAQLLVKNHNAVYKLKFQIHVTDSRLVARYLDYLSSLSKRDFIRERDFLQYCLRYNERLKFYSEAEIYYNNHRCLPKYAINRLFQSNWFEQELMTETSNLQTFINGTIEIVLSCIAGSLSEGDYSRLNEYLSRIFSTAVYINNPDCVVCLICLAKASSVLASYAHKPNMYKNYSSIAQRLEMNLLEGIHVPFFDIILNALQVDLNVRKQLMEARAILDNGLPVSLCRLILNKAKNGMSRLKQLQKDDKIGDVIPAFVNCAPLFELFFELNGDCYRIEEEYERAITMYLMSIKYNFMDGFHDRRNQCAHYQKIGLCYIKIGNNEMALHYLQYGNEINLQPSSFSEMVEEESLKSLLKCQIADCYSKMGDYEKAIRQMIALVSVFDHLRSVTPTTDALYDYAVACYKVLEYECSAQINPSQGMQYGYAALSAFIDLDKASPGDNYRKQIGLCLKKLTELEG